MNTNYNALAAEAAAWVMERMAGNPIPRLALITGSGLGMMAAAVRPKADLKTSDIPHWPPSTVEGHAGRLIVGTLENVPIIVMQGRVHFYEGYTIQAVAFPIRVLQALGVQVLIVTNAAGGLEPSWAAGDVMVLSDHISLPGLGGFNPLMGPNDTMLGPRFPSLANAYSPRLRKLAHEVAAEQGLNLRVGVYVNVSGPSYETPAELRFLHLIGGHAVGMSTAPEVIVANHAGIEVLGFSLITNMALLNPNAEDNVSHAEVLEVGTQAGPRLERLITALLPKLA